MGHYNSQDRRKAIRTTPKPSVFDPSIQSRPTTEQAAAAGSTSRTSTKPKLSTVVTSKTQTPEKKSLITQDQSPENINPPTFEERFDDVDTTTPEGQSNEQSDLAKESAITLPVELLDRFLQKSGVDTDRFGTIDKKTLHSMGVTSLFSPALSTGTNNIITGMGNLPTEVYRSIAANPKKVLAAGAATLFIANKISSKADIASWAAVDNVGQGSVLRANSIVWDVKNGDTTATEAIATMNEIQETVNYATRYVDLNIKYNPSNWFGLGKPMAIALETARLTLEDQSKRLNELQQQGL